MCDCAVILLLFGILFDFLSIFKRDFDRFLTSVGGSRWSATNGLSAQMNCQQIKNREIFSSQGTDLQSGKSVGLGGQTDKVLTFRQTFLSRDRDYEGGGNVAGVRTSLEAEASIARLVHCRQVVGPKIG